MKKSGFTLIELLSVIIVLGVVIGVAIPGINMVIVNGRKNTFVKDAQIMNTNINQKISANLIKRPKENGVTIVSIDQIQTDNDRESAFRAEWDYTRSYFLIHNHKKNNKTVYDHYVALLDEKGNGVELIKVNDLEKKHVIKEPTIVQIGTGLLEGSPKGRQSFIPQSIFSSIKNANKAVVYSNNSHDENTYGENLIPLDKRTMENWNYHQGSSAIKVRAPLIGRNLLKNSDKSNSVLMRSNNDNLYPISREYLMDDNIEFQRVKRTSLELNPNTLSIYSHILPSHLYDDITGKEITVSFSARASIETTSTVMIWAHDGSTNVHLENNNSTITLKKTWERYSFTFTIPNQFTILRVNPLSVNMKNEGSNFYFDISQYNIEYSNNALKEWQPAWEEMPLSEKPATYIKTSGGTSIVKYYMSLWCNEEYNVQYNKQVWVNNIGVNPVFVGTNGFGPSTRVNPSEIKQVNVVGGKTQPVYLCNQLQFNHNANEPIDLEFIAYNPIIRRVN